MLGALVLAVLGTAAFASLGLFLAGALRAEATLAAANLVYLLLLAGGAVVLPARRTATPRPVLALLPSGALGEGLRDGFLRRHFPLEPGRGAGCVGRGRHSADREDLQVGVTRARGPAPAQPRRPRRRAPGDARAAPWALAASANVASIVLTGGAVRLTGSGLGCPTWPRCTDESFVPHGALGVHGGDRVRQPDC